MYVCMYGQECRGDRGKGGKEGGRLRVEETEKKTNTTAAEGEEAKISLP